ncbi:Hypothetical predicted protein [Octopus vulgaris]|uniref:Uncharacterized protein n=1 Tax=Octopus vulgaris TaxID=6645 RepID=A0AA36BVY5_OCTVU|nr:Hypothetical predicted protein [Octopus vulgaris]
MMQINCHFVAGPSVSGAAVTPAVENCRFMDGMANGKLIPDSDIFLPTKESPEALRPSGIAPSSPTPYLGSSPTVENCRFMDGMANGELIPDSDIFIPTKESPEALRPSGIGWKIKPFTSSQLEVQIDNNILKYGAVIILRKHKNVATFLIIYQKDHSNVIRSFNATENGTIPQGTNVDQILIHFRPNISDSQLI